MRWVILVVIIGPGIPAAWIMGLPPLETFLTGYPAGGCVSLCKTVMMNGLVVTTQGLHEVSPGEAEILSLEQLLHLFNAPNRICLGFVATGLPNPGEQLRNHLGRLERTLSLGWTSVAWTVRGSDGQADKALGGFAPPAPARPYGTSPRGLFLVDVGRWEKTWVGQERQSSRSWLEWSEEFYRRQRDLGLIFCDPSMEMTSDQNFVVSPWRKRSKFSMALSSFRAFVE